MTRQTDHAKGLLITGIGGMALTVDIPLIRLANGEPWSVLLLRAGTTVLAALVIWAVWRSITPKAPPLLPGFKGVMVATLYGMSSTCFVLGVFYTTTANLVFIVAFSTMIAALLSWLFLNERPRPATLAALVAMVAGVGIIVSDSIGTGNLVGDLLAGGAAVSIATAITISRSSEQSMGFAALIGAAIPCAVAALMVARAGFAVEVPGWVLFNGTVVMPIAFFCLGAGPRWISGPEVAMFYLLETVLAPVWVWMIFAEVPSARSLIGGAVLIGALLAHTVWQLVQARRARRPVPLPAPAE